MLPKPSRREKRSEDCTDNLRSLQSSRANVEVLADFKVFPTKVWGSRSTWEGHLRTEISAHNLSKGLLFINGLVNASLAGDPFNSASVG